MLIIKDSEEDMPSNPGIGESSFRCKTLSRSSNYSCAYQINISSCEVNVFIMKTLIPPIPNILSNRQNFHIKMFDLKIFNLELEDLGNLEIKKNIEGSNTI